MTIDTIRADHCSTYGYDRLTTPTVSRLADAGVLFWNAYAPMATTGPSHASLFTSLYPRSHGFVKNGFVLNERALTLAEVCRDSGYQTQAIVSSYPLAARFGLDQGFDGYDDSFEGHGGAPKPRQWEGMVVEGHFERDARVTTDRASNWLRNEREADIPFFLWVHYFDPHAPYRPASEYESFFLSGSGDDPAPKSLEFKKAMYDAEIRETDDALARLLEVINSLKLRDSTVLVVAGDHGEGLMQHGYMKHGLHIYEEAVRVPLVMSWPGKITTGLVVQEPVELLDVSPTLLEITGIGTRFTDQQGSNLTPVVTGRKTADKDRLVFLERRRYEARKIQNHSVIGSKLGIRFGSWKYIEALEEGTRELFDLSVDPLEATNLASTHPEVVAQMSRKLDVWQQNTPRLFPSRNTVVSEEDAQMLEAMGYVQ